MSYSISRKNNAFYTYDICDEANKSWEGEKKGHLLILKGNTLSLQLFLLDIILINNTFEYDLNMGIFFFQSNVWMWELDHKEGWVLKNWCFWTVVLEKTLKSPLDSKDQTSQSQRKLTLKIHWKNWCWSWSSNILATWWEELNHWRRPWCWEGLKAGEGDDRGWDGWMASLMQWTWVWASSGS